MNNWGYYEDGIIGNYFKWAIDSRVKYRFDSGKKIWVFVNFQTKMELRIFFRVDTPTGDYWEMIYRPFNNRSWGIHETANSKKEVFKRFRYKYAKTIKKITILYEN